MYMYMCMQQGSPLSRAVTDQPKGLYGNKHTLVTSRSRLRQYQHIVQSDHWVQYRVKGIRTTAHFWLIRCIILSISRANTCTDKQQKHSKTLAYQCPCKGLVALLFFPSKSALSSIILLIILRNCTLLHVLMLPHPQLTARFYDF